MCVSDLIQHEVEQRVKEDIDVYKSTPSGVDRGKLNMSAENKKNKEFKNNTHRRSRLTRLSRGASETLRTLTDNKQRKK